MVRLMSIGPKPITPSVTIDPNSRLGKLLNFNKVQEENPFLIK